MKKSLLLFGILSTAGFGQGYPVMPISDEFCTNWTFFVDMNSMTGTYPADGFPGMTYPNGQTGELGGCGPNNYSCIYTPFAPVFGKITVPAFLGKDMKEKDLKKIEKNNKELDKLFAESTKMQTAELEKYNETLKKHPKGPMSREWPTEVKVPNPWNNENYNKTMTTAMKVRQESLGIVEEFGLEKKGCFKQYVKSKQMQSLIHMQQNFDLQTKLRSCNTKKKEIVSVLEKSNEDNIKDIMDKVQEINSKPDSTTMPGGSIFYNTF